jgi:hypothetical protein
MTTVFQQLLARAVADEKFGHSLQVSPDETLKPYRLSAGESAALKSLHPQLLEALRQREKETTDPRSWRKPANFRETGAALLSAILVVLLIYATWLTFSQVSATPLTYSIDGNVQIVDTFGRAKDLLNIFFPLFGAVVTFWLGVTVEGRRADRNEAEAEQARDAKEVAQAEARETRNTAADALAEAEAAVVEQMQFPGSGFERGGSDTARPGQAALQDALAALRSARQKLAR